MKHHLARLRMEAAVSIAREHPELRLEDIGVALGFSSTSAKSMLSTAIRKAGISRPRGFAAPSYDPAVKAEYTSGGNKQIDREKMRRLLLQKNPRLTYEQISTKMDCHLMSVVVIAAELNLSRGIENRVQRPPLVATDAEIRAHYRRNPSNNLSRAARALGFKKPGSLKKRVVRLGIEVAPTRIGRPRATTMAKAA